MTACLISSSTLSNIWCIVLGSKKPACLLVLGKKKIRIAKDDIVKGLWILTLNNLKTILLKSSKIVNKLLQSK